MNSNTTRALLMGIVVTVASMTIYDQFIKPIFNKGN